MTATQTKVDAKPETEVDAETAAIEALKADTTIVVDVKFQTLITSVDNIESKLGGKWVDVADYLIKQKWVPLTLEEEKEPSKERQAEFKHAKNVILKSLIEMGKTYKSAQSIRTQILKLAKPSMKEARDGLRAGTMTVRESREFGRTPQANPAVPRNNETRYSEALANMVRYGIALGYDTVKLYADVGAKFAEYSRDNNNKATDEAKAKEKAEFQQAIAETKAQLKS